MGSSDPLSVVHVLPRDMVRGAQVFAKVLRDRLDGPKARHRTLTLFQAPPGALWADHELGITPGVLRRAGFDGRVFLALRAKLRELAPDVVVAHGGEPLKYCVKACPGEARLVYYKIGSSRSVAQRHLRSVWHRRLLRSADQVVTISDELTAEITTVFGIAPDRVVTIPNGRDPRLYGLADHDAAPVRLAFVGHIEAPKRPLWFVEVVRRVVAAHPDVRAAMAGDGPQMDEVRAEAADLPIDVLGRREDVTELLASSHVLVSPSSREGMPGVFIEAGMTSLPVVSTDVAGAGTVLEDGVTGHIVAQDDLDKLAERTRELVADAGLRRTMGAAARERCLERFTVDAVAARWADLLADLAP